MNGLHLHSKSSVARLLDALQERGHITRSKNANRSITITGDNDGFVAGWNAAITAAEQLFTSSLLSCEEKLTMLRSLKKPDV